MTSQTAIKVTNLTKSFKIPLDKGRSVKKRILGRSSKGYRTFTPLDDVSFTINKGDFFAIAGRNGSGKSTLLKTIAGIYEPTKGKVDVEGVLVPFIELGVGFNPQLTGRENVYLNAALLGFSRQETDAIYEDIVDFAELHDFMEERLQNYSSGMQVRLAFSIAIRAKGDILLLDEVLAVGDTAFQQKCFTYFEQLKREKKTVILVTHSMSNVERFCNRGLLLDQGKVTHIGSSDEIAQEYRKLFESSAASRKEKDLIGRQESEIIQLDRVYLSQDENETTANGTLDSRPFRIHTALKLKDESYGAFNVTIQIRDKNDLLVFSGDTMSVAEHCFDIKDHKKVSVVMEIDNVYAQGAYRIDVFVRGAAQQNGQRSREQVLAVKEALYFTVERTEGSPYSLVHPAYTVDVKGGKARSSLWNDKADE